MRWRTAALLMLACALAACASEGGSRGSGISTLIRGNVESVQPAVLRAPVRAAARPPLARLGEFLPLERVADASSAVEGIEVILEGTTLQAETDADGHFSIQGDFEGMSTLVFQRSADGLRAQILVNVPAGGTYTLNGISIDAVQQTAVPASRQADFDGVITDVTCGNSIITMRSVQQNSSDLDRYMMTLDTSILQDSHGAPLTCADLRVGQQAMVAQAQAHADGTFSGGLIQVEQ